MRVKTNRHSFKVTPVLSLGAYATGDAVDALISISEAVSSSDQSGTITQLILSDIDGNSDALDFVFYQSAVTDGTDNAAYAPSIADLRESVGSVSLVAADYAALGARSVATKDLNLDFQLEASTTLFLQIVSRAAPTYTAVDSLQLKLVIQKD